MTQLSLPPVARPAFFEGQVLRADDLADLVDLERSMRWLHNRSFHGWGIALGLEPAARRGDSTVMVRPGHAVDAAGRDLLLEDPLTLAVPAVAAAPDGKAAPYVLTISYTPDDEAVVERASGACGTDGAVRRSDAPTVRWQPAGTQREGLDVVLAATGVLACTLASDLETVTVRRSLRPPTHPYLATGSTGTGPAWQLWPEGGPARGVQVTVDTSASGFAETPAYQCRVVGARLLDSWLSPIGSDSMVDGHPHVADAGARSFVAVVPLPQGVVPWGNGSLTVNNPAVVGDPSLAKIVRDYLTWSIAWIGIEG